MKQTKFTQQQQQKDGRKIVPNMMIIPYPHLDCEYVSTITRALCNKNKNTFFMPARATATTTTKKINNNKKKDAHSYSLWLGKMLTAIKIKYFANFITGMHIVTVNIQTHTNLRYIGMSSYTTNAHNFHFFFNFFLFGFLLSLPRHTSQKFHWTLYYAHKN